MQKETIIQVPDNLWPVADFFMRDLGGEVNLADESQVTTLIQGFMLLYLTVVVFAVLAYKFGFAKKLPPLKSAIIYILLFIGTFFLTLIFGLNLPLAESLFIIALVMGVYRLRLSQERKQRG
ncbi:YlaH-like family protein [Gracilibacillus sp. S3-1-1]|uniref:YlaH-like family protein n=1 Tax=Gracilibacillus pellucidus TaxID=3095368 RepID=A0ACC6M1R5_9BACI|nr:YlaH-like family protein [Gracilibacillus sp. S3-1-1]MDX8044889.1 YlaH-like family protein [Gracilibacillus sp. S3-1-1]